MTALALVFKEVLNLWIKETRMQAKIFPALHIAPVSMLQVLHCITADLDNPLPLGSCQLLFHIYHQQFLLCIYPQIICVSNKSGQSEEDLLNIPCRGHHFVDHICYHFCLYNPFPNSLLIHEFITILTSPVWLRVEALIWQNHPRTSFSAGKSWTKCTLFCFVTTDVTPERGTFTKTLILKTLLHLHQKFQVINSCFLLIRSWSFELT